MSAYYYVFGNNVYVILVGLVIVFAVFDAFEEGKDFIPNSRKIEIWDLFKCCGLKREQKVDKKKEQSEKEMSFVKKMFIAQSAQRVQIIGEGDNSATKQN